ncbi:hypothetical protein JCM21738_1417 [Mesobacillus boroniphilus JCM 21738]|uniref:Uncharacterized protein n=1 Tax=Mesobacillus boroniphilus JCM 21738 TaxID=1294265 RepID=W4RK48_9BACI|nr:hypothetical protein JCM21738_1417 [Mesobacillus boroniphilus JCM 21738]
MESESVQAFLKQFHLRQNAVFTEDTIEKILGMTVITAGKMVIHHTNPRTESIFLR